MPARFTIGTKYETKDLSQEVNVDPRLLAVYHIKKIAGKDNLEIPDNFNNPSLSRLKRYR